MKKIILLFICLSFCGIAFARTLSVEQKREMKLRGKKQSLQFLLNRKAKLEAELEKVNAAIARHNAWITANDK
ncbi:MAG: hypothetical protein WC312_03790 [Candidatus Omnitrophota bacterium]|jgi:peptidoglycan hydrolase CwlO-like protein